uniref:Uncharacterized protein n=1 Tax=Fagus sylvatica TaxID=28930 RepID=A0A2N9GJ99_FAGSY
MSRAVELAKECRENTDVMSTIKPIADEVVAESVDDVTADFADEVKYAQSESPKDNNSTKIALEMIDLHLAPMSCVMKIVVEVYEDSLLSVVFRKSISEILVVLPILVALWMQRSIDAASFDEIVVVDAVSKIIAGAIDIATNLDNDTAIAIFISKEISVVDDFLDMEDMAEVHDSCNVVLVGGYEQEDVIDAVDLTAIISQDKECEPRRVDATNNIGMKEDEDVDVTKAIGLVVDIMADALIVDLFNPALR